MPPRQRVATCTICKHALSHCTCSIETLSGDPWLLQQVKTALEARAIRAEEAAELWRSRAGLPGRRDDDATLARLQRRVTALERENEELRRRLDGMRPEARDNDETTDEAKLRELSERFGKLELE